MRNRILSLAVALLLVLGTLGLELGSTPAVLAADEATMEITPSAGLYSTSHDFTVDVVLHTGLSAINAARAEIVYDPAQLALVTIDGASSVLTMGAPTDYSTTPDGRSQVDINRAIIGQYTGDGVMARVTFHALVAGVTPVTLVMTKSGTMPVEGSMMLTAVGSSNVLTATTSGSYILADPGVTVNPSTVTVTEGGAGSSYTVALTAPPIAAVTVGITPDAQVTASPTTLVFTSANWSVPQTVTVNAVDDTAAEGGHIGTLTHAATSRDWLYNGLAVSPVTVSVADNDYTLTVNTTGSGSIAKNPDQTVYTQGASVQVMATPAVGWHFTGWSGDLVGSTDPETITMTDNKTITAAFAINVHTITATAGAGGTISPSGPVPVNHGADQAFTIIPVAGYHILDVLADGTSVGAVATYTFANVTDNHTIAASFTAVSLVIPGDVDGGGTVTMLDVLLAARAATGITTLTGSALQAADIDHSGTITMLDVLLIARIAMGLGLPD